MIRTQMLSYEVRLYMGGRVGYQGPEIRESELLPYVQALQTQYKEEHNLESEIGVRVTRTTFLAGDHQESGWEIAAVKYPMHPLPAATILEFMTWLAETLGYVFSQVRVNLITSDGFILLLDRSDEPKDTMP